MPHFEELFLRSLAAQTFKNFEVIIVDGGSKDDSMRAAAEYIPKLNIQFIVDTTRNIGYIRNVGAYRAQGEIIFETSSDIYFPHTLLEDIDREYRERDNLVALGGRTYPTGSTPPITAHIGYAIFDLIRFFMTTRITPIKKIRPSGNFLTIRREVFNELGGYPEVKINEDGLFGFKLDEYLKRNRHKDVMFSLKHKVIHHVKRFEKKGGIQSILFYFYVLGLIFPMLKPILAPIERKSALEFSTRSDLE